MNFNNFNEFKSAIRNFAMENPTAFWTVKDDPRNLRCGILALTNEGETHFTINIAKMKKGSISEDEKKENLRFCFNKS